ncbi:MAG: haloacid dehalogenase type II [Thermoleophilaceae bacterium]|nr:haloacid dehalogenase type II [Thermoleophilaceae bacterium]
MAALDFGAFDALTFDCYGTLIDWESGILAALRPVLDAHGVQADDEELLEAYGRHELEIEAGPYLRYREVVGRALRGIGRDYGFEPTDEEVAAFADSVGDWPPFEDSHEALARLKKRYLLAVITNCDDDLFARSQQRLGVRFDWAITAEQVGSYKPSVRNFEAAFHAIAAPRERILHVAQSLYHDHVPAQRIGLRSVWVDRRGDRPGSGATPPADAAPDLTVPDLRTLADLALADRG